MITAILFVWYVSGVWSHVYWVRNKYDYSTDYIGESLFAGITGPISFLIGWSVYGDPSQPKILWPKRLPPPPPSHRSGSR